MHAVVEYTLQLAKNFLLIALISTLKHKPKIKARPRYLTLFCRHKPSDLSGTWTWHIDPNAMQTCLLQLKVSLRSCAAFIQTFLQCFDDAGWAAGRACGL